MISVYDSMIITFYNISEVKNYIVKLQSFNIEHDGDIARINIPSLKIHPEWVENPAAIALVVSDDPTLNHAGDWMNLGFSRILYFIDNPVRKNTKYFCYEGKLRTRSIIIPERIPSDENHPANLFI